jgi:hypothetical protein
MKLPSNIHVKAYGAEALVELTPEVRDLLTREDKFGGKYCMYRQDQPGQKYVYVPRGLVDRSKADSVQVSHRPVKALTPSSPPQTEDQAQVIEASLSLLNKGVDHLIEAPTGFGKCALHGETVVMFDGSVKEVQDVIVGDLLMGPDSNPRKVLALGSGVTQAYALHTVKGETLRFNEDHILSLRCCGGGDYGQAGDLIEVSIKDYLTWPKSKKHEYKLWKPDCIQFVSSGRLPVDPYLVGAMLGDGGFTQYPTFHSVDKPLLDVIRDKLHFYGSELRFRSGCSYGIVGGNALIYFRALELDRCHGRDKFIPAPYLTASVKDRLQLLAGLLDTDGHLVKRTVFEYVTQSVKLASDFERLCWSLGFACTKKQGQKTCQYKGNAVGGLYWRLHVSGATHTIPTVLARKRAKVREQKKNVHNHGFTVEDLGQQPYYGFHLTEDCLYLTGNYFVTHNTYVGAVVAGKLAQKTLIVVTKNDLTTSWRETLTKFMGQSPSSIGHVQQNVLKYENCQFTIAMIHTLVEREYDQKFYEAFGLIIFDECHRLGADYFAQACSKFNATHRLGLSATPERSDGKQDLFQAHIGPVMVRGKWVPMSPKVLVKKTGFKLPMAWQRSETGQWVKAPMKVVPGRMAPVTKVLADDYNRNQEIVKFVKSAYDAGRNTVVMSDLIDGHLTPLFHLLAKAGIPGEHIGYYHGQVKKENLEANKLKRVVLATYLMCGEGTNVVQWDTLVLATPRSNVKQPIGRIMRFAEGKKTPVVLELVDDNEVLKAFHFSRLKQYYSVKAEIVNMS